MLTKQESKETPETGSTAAIVDTAFKSVGLAMGIAVAVLSFLNQIGTQSAIGMPGIGLACVAIASLNNKEK